METSEMQEKKSTIRYERVKDVLDLAIRLQAARGGMTIDEIQEELSVSRRTAERMRNTVEWAFAGLETVPAGDNKLHWRLESNALRRLVPIT
ncbi:MAG: HTH domain-containing protein, partial [Gammaproteobacteria bacterium]|nr:HTH domain-containing protein [Gammaproteobacteria bacterium]